MLGLAGHSGGEHSPLLDAEQWPGSIPSTDPGQDSEQGPPELISYGPADGELVAAMEAYEHQIKEEHRKAAAAMAASGGQPADAPLSENEQSNDTVAIEGFVPGTLDEQTGFKSMEPGKTHFGGCISARSFIQRAFAVASGPADVKEGQRDRRSGIKLAEPPTGDRPWHKWLQVERPAADESAQHRSQADSDQLGSGQPKTRNSGLGLDCVSQQQSRLASATETAKMSSMVAGAVASTPEPDIDLLWSYVFPHESPVAAKMDGLGLPRWFMDLAKPTRVPVQERAQPIARTKSLTRPAEVKKTRRTSFVNHARTPSASLVGASPKADGAANLGQSIFSGSVQQVLEELANAA
ncbi:Pde9a [Symbiodinium sp. CCMP2592]|nr:Pde9a [Symbiodinium sp. CCMP2592]